MKAKKEIFFLLLMLMVAPVADACWKAAEIAEIEGFSELDGKVILSFKDAINCNPLVNASVSIGSKSMQTDFNGYLTLPISVFARMMDETLDLKVIKKGYINLHTQLIIQVGTIINKRFAISPALKPENLRFVLQWSDQPDDLDLHLKGPDFHISYRNKRQYSLRAKLDIDAQEGYGPETITLQRAHDNEKYEVWVDNYSGSPSFNGKVTVDVYAQNQLYKSIKLGSSQKPSNHVLTLENGEITIHNKFSHSRP